MRLLLRPGGLRLRRACRASLALDAARRRPRADGQRVCGELVAHDAVESAYGAHAGRERLADRRGRRDPRLAPAPLHAQAYAATGPRPAPAPSFSGPVSSSGASSVPTTVRAPRGVYIALIASAAAVILVLFVFLLWKLLGS